MAALPSECQVFEEKAAEREKKAYSRTRKSDWNRVFAEPDWSLALLGLSGHPFAGI
jgi:hypothetical protein